MKQTKQYKNYLITTLALSTVSTNALADGFTDGKFFLGASINIQQDAYKLDKPNSAPQARVGDLSSRASLSQVALSTINNQLEIYKELVGDNPANMRNPFSMFGFGCLAGCSPAGITEFYINKKGYDAYEALSKIKTVTNDNMLEVVELISTIQTEKIKAQKETVAFHQWYSGLTLTSNTVDVVNTTLTSSTTTEEVKNSEIYKNMIAWFEREKIFNIANAAGSLLISVGQVLGKDELYEIYSSENFLVSGDMVYNSANVKDLTQFLTDITNSIADKIADNKQTEAEADQIKTSASKWVPSASLLAGYRFNKGNFGFITELGIDLTSSKVGKNDKENMEAEVKNIFHFYLTQKAGYRFTESSLTYITAGFGLKDYKAEYKGVSSKLNVNESKILPTFVIGAGYEHQVTTSLAVFTEFNHIMTLSKLKTEIGDFSMRSEQIRVGVRWYL
jgi:opacity protein-like surface antigen